MSRPAAAVRVRITEQHTVTRVVEILDFDEVPESEVRRRRVVRPAASLPSPPRPLAAGGGR